MNKINNYIIYIGNCLKFWRKSDFDYKNYGLWKRQES